ncbi:OmpA family protein [Mucilaginibacter robiniae]|uniref:OmpA family protein n=1 Tax=Mucilaginibacter robiniae TaxID=2728022 RepID=A0A7L5E785_9SPHI|nr:OmpA family protein [Mucilaginibacter robiniae]QJD98169.1 OmpA family protein [Mucilaginibacter robiniae]
MKYWALCVSLCLVSALTAKGQNKLYSTSNSSAITYYQKANGSLDRRNLPEAITYLQSAIAADDNFTEAHAQLGDLFKLQQQYKQAIEQFRKVIQLNPEFSRAVYLKLGESEVSLADYSQAQQHLEKYLTYPNSTPENQHYARKLISDCVFSIDALKHPVPFKPVNLGPEINTANDEYLPVSTADENTLIFTRKVNNNEDFFKSQKQDKHWTNATYLSKQINTIEYNEGAQSISQDGQYLFFTGCNRPDGLGRCDIYVTQKKGDDWNKPFNLSAPINSPAWESQPSISADGRTLYFVSNRKGGYGGYDIYKCRLTNTGWTQPENLGPNINTPLDEQSPFIHPDDSTMYFCSNGWPGMGNKDLFVSRLGKDGKWQKPQNLGYPINSSGDENGMSITANGTYAFFASNTLSGYGGFDIYTFELPEAARPHLVTYVKGTVAIGLNKQPIDAAVEIVDLEKNQTVYQNYTSAAHGEFLATLPVGKNYGLTITKNGYLFYSENFSLKDHQSGKPYQIDIALDPIEIGKKAILKNIFFDTNKYTLKPESESALEKLMDFMKLNPAVRIEIAGYTDNVGNDQVNLILSGNRAKAVYQYLITHGVAADRLVYKGYGKLQPIAPNTTEENRSQNRRTEFKIIAK